MTILSAIPRANENASSRSSDWNAIFAVSQRTHSAKQIHLCEVDDLIPMPVQYSFKSKEAETFCLFEGDGRGMDSSCLLTGTSLSAGPSCWRACLITGWT